MILTPLLKSIKKFTRSLPLLWLSCLLLPHISMAQYGNLDFTFGNGGIVRTDVNLGNDYGFSTVVQNDGKIIVAGIARVGTSNNDFGILRYNIDGTLDAGFGVNGIVTVDIATLSTDEAHAVCLQNDGKIVVAGSCGPTGNIPYNFAVVRLNANGIPDSTFGGDGIVTTDIGGENDFANSMKIQSDGKIVVAGYSGTASNNSLAVIRYNTNGSLDSTFDNDGIVKTQAGYLYLYGQAVCIQPNGKIVATATTGTTPAINNSDILVVRYNTNGSLDTTFDHDGMVTTDHCYQDYAYSVAVQTDGKIVVAGSSIDTINVSMGTNVSVVRYNSNGSLDTTFDGDGKLITEVTPLTDVAYSVALQSDGKIVIAGHSSDGVGNFRIILVRYQNDGSLDNTFGIDGMVTTDLASEHEFGESVAIQDNGRIVVTGFFRDGATFDIFVARYIGGAPLQTGDILSNPTIILSPNPFSDQLTLQSNINLDDAVLSIYNVAGDKVKEMLHCTGSTLIIEKGNLTNGLYLLYVTQKERILMKEKIMIAAD